jgi:hypothetical protein
MYTTRDFYEFAAGKNQQLVGMAYAREGALLPRSQGRNSSWSHLEWQVAEYNKYCNALEHFRLAGNTAKMTNKSVGGASIEQFPEFQGATPEFFEFLYASALRSRLVAAADYSRPDLAGDINPKDIDKNAAENLQGSVSSVEGWRKLIPSPQCDNFDPVDTLFKDLQNPQGALSESLALGQHEFREVDHPEWWRFGGEKCLHDKQIRNQLGSFQSTEKLSAVDKHTYERKEKCLYKLSDEFLGKFEKGQMNKGDFGLLLPTLKLLSDACTSSNESKSGESRGPTENFRAYKRIEFHPENLKGIMKDLTDFCSNV